MLMAINRMLHHRLHAIVLLFSWTIVLVNGDDILRDKLMHAPFYFPQLYKCINRHQEVPQNETMNGQANADKWLNENVFSKLPRSELIGATFVEIGAYDGVDYSTSYFFEKTYDWRGLLIEGHPQNQKKLHANAKERLNSVLITSAICDFNQLTKRHGTIRFTGGGDVTAAAINQTSAGFLSVWHGKSNKNMHHDVQCVPIQKHFEYTGMIDIDLFSLDVEGAELYVLKTIDFNVTNIRVVVVEADGYDKTKDQNVRDVLTSNGFVNVIDTIGDINKACTSRKGCTQNEVYVNPNFKAKKDKRIREMMNFNRYFHHHTGVACGMQQGNFTRFN